MISENDVLTRYTVCLSIWHIREKDLPKHFLAKLYEHLYEHRSCCVRYVLAASCQ